MSYYSSKNWSKKTVPSKIFFCYDIFSSLLTNFLSIKSGENGGRGYTCTYNSTIFFSKIVQKMQCFLIGLSINMPKNGLLTNGTIKNDLNVRNEYFCAKVFFDFTNKKIECQIWWVRWRLLLSYNSSYDVSWFQYVLYVSSYFPKDNYQQASNNL